MWYDYIIRFKQSEVIIKLFFVNNILYIYFISVLNKFIFFL